MVIHFHFSPIENSGEVRRIKNIDKDVAGILSQKIVEVEFYPFRIGRGKIDRFVLSDKVVKKIYVPVLGAPAKNYFLCWLDQFWPSLVMALICLCFRADYVIGEYSISFKAMKFLRLLYPRVKRIVDVHGACPEEYVYATQDAKSWYKKELEKLELSAIKYAHCIICQSDEQKRLLQEKYKASPSKIVVYRCGVDLDRFPLDAKTRMQIREELGIGSTTCLFVYSGGLHKWQKVEDSLRFFLQYHKINSDSKFLILTKDMEILNSLLETQEFSPIREDLIIRTLPFDEVAKYLNASDIAFLLRDNVVMNAVASPTKLAEYMACGLPVISTRVARKWLQKCDYIYCYDGRLDVREVNALLKMPKKDIRKYCSEQLSLSADRRRVRAFFVGFCA